MASFAGDMAYGIVAAAGCGPTFEDAQPGPDPWPFSEQITLQDSHTPAIRCPAPTDSGRAPRAV
ncbi:MAG: hypothetical protein MI742_17800 [Desulfobacterales bacterium]|nr:hypothetical protein [Desulfobacterales bacterium]